MYKPAMARPPRSAASDTRERLLRAGMRLARQRGLKAVTVRAVAAAAEANLGTFVYHFGSRDAFVGELIERWYAPLFRRLQLGADDAPDALSALRHTVLQLVDWLIRNRRFVARLAQDAAAGEPAVQRFLGGLDARHPALLHALVLRAQQQGGLRRDDPWHQLLFVMSTLALPVLMFELATGASTGAAPLLRQLAAYTTDPVQAARRLDWALRGLAADDQPATGGQR